MDRFKFRGRRIDNEELVYGSLLRNEFGWNIVTFESVLVDPDTNSHDLEMILVGIVDGSQEQCTGLKDKNGKLIFEGDVCRIDSYGTDYESSTMNCIIKYVPDFMTFCPFPKKYLDWYEKGSNHFKYCGDVERSAGFRHFLYQFESYEIEIIGNIHENPELLEA